MRKLLIFTNVYRLSSVFPEFIKKRTELNYLKSDKTKIFFWQEISNVFEKVENINENGIYFIADDINENIYTELTNSINKDELFILNHKHGAKYLANEKHVAIGMTELEDNGGIYYPDVVRILQDEKSNKFERVFNSIFKSEPAIELISSLLLDCRVSEGANTCLLGNSLIDKYRAISGTKINGTTIYQIVKNIAGGNGSGDWENLRNYLQEELQKNKSL